MNVTTSVVNGAPAKSNSAHETIARVPAPFPVATALIFATPAAPHRATSMSSASTSSVAVARVAFVREHEFPGLARPCHVARRHAFERLRVLVDLRQPERVAVGAHPKTLAELDVLAVTEAVVHESARLDVRGLDDERVAVPAAGRESRLRVRRALGRVWASVEENDADHVEVFHFENDQVAALIDLHRKRRLHVEDDGRRHAGVLALELLRVVVLLDLLDRGRLELQPGEISGGELARARIVDQHRALRQRVDQRLARRLALELHRPEA